MTFQSYHIGMMKSLLLLGILVPQSICAFSFLKLNPSKTLISPSSIEESRRHVLRKAILTPAISSLLFLPPTPPSHASSDNYIAKPTSLLILPNTFSKTPIKIPTIGYSLYKTDASQVQRGIALALAAGVRNFDVGTLYQTNAIAGELFLSYINTGIIPNATMSEIVSDAQARREELFLSHKLSNAEQSSDVSEVKQSIQNEMEKLKVDYLDLCSVHSPLTNKEKRLGSYKALLELKNEGKIKAIGVCNYGVAALEEIVSEGLPPPSVIQLELSPFNQHKDVAKWSKKHGSILSCGAWSKLSSVSGPQDGWAIVAAMAKEKRVTKQQILIRWSLHKGYICNPRSGTGSKLERNTIAENSFMGVSGFSLSRTDMKVLDALDEQLKAGRLGRRDGWGDEDVLDEDWDPTEIMMR